MSLSITVFGQLVDITHSDTIEVEDVCDTNQLISKMIERFPAIKNHKYAIAVNKTIIRENTPLQDNSVVALLPPFSGG